MNPLVKKNAHDVLGLFSNSSYKNGDLIFELKGTISNTPVRESIMVGPGKHVVDEYGAFFNHSCNPNTKIVGNKVYATKDIPIGTELVFDYTTTEEKLANPFVCFCCGKMIKEGTKKT